MSEAQRKVIVRNELAISAITVWELCLLAEKGRVVSEGPAHEFARRLVNLSGVAIIPIDAEIASLSRTLSFSHSDPADRFIAASAVALNIPLVTADQVLVRGAGPNNFRVIA